MWTFYKITIGVKRKKSFMRARCAFWRMLKFQTRFMDGPGLGRAFTCWQTGAWVLEMKVHLGGWGGG